MANWQLRFSDEKIGVLADLYSYDDDGDVTQIGSRVREAKHYTYEDFLAMCEWKSPRSKSRCRRNKPEEVVEATGIALAAREERLRVGALRCLHGVDWPTASVLLHFGHSESYPILDVRALWSLGFDKLPASYTFDLWWKYVGVCRDLAERNGVSMRVLDRALWQFSKENQSKLS